MAEQPRGWGKAGEPVRLVNPADINAVWKLYRDIEAQHPGQQVGVCRDVLMIPLPEGVDTEAVAYRTILLRVTTQTRAPEIAPWVRAGYPDEALLRAIAEIPMEWMGDEVRQGLPFNEEDFMRRLRNEPQQA